MENINTVQKYRQNIRTMDVFYGYDQNYTSIQKRSLNKHSFDFFNFNAIVCFSKKVGLHLIIQFIKQLNHSCDIVVRNKCWEITSLNLYL